MATSPPAINEITLSFPVIYLYNVSRVRANLPVDPHPQINTRWFYAKVSLIALCISFNSESLLNNTSNTWISKSFILSIALGRSCLAKSDKPTV